MKSHTVEVILGTCVITVACAFLSFAYIKSGMPKDHTVSYFAQFDRVDGVQTGGDVRLSGVKVGSIHKITLDPKNYLARIEICVQKDLILPKDSSAEIISDGLLGGKYLALVPGGDDENLKPNDQIMDTQSSVSLESMIGQLIFDKTKDPTTPEPKSKKTGL